MASSIEDILYAKALANAEDNSNYGLTVGTSALGGTAGLAMGRGFRGRMAGGLVGAILGGALGAGVREQGIQNNPAAGLLAKLQAQGSLNMMDRAQLQSVLKDIYSNPGM